MNLLRLLETISRLQARAEEHPAPPFQITTCVCGKRVVNAENGLCALCGHVQTSMTLDRRAALLLAAGIPSGIAIEPFEERPWPTDPHPAVSLRLDMWDGIPWCATIHGPTGSGKTMLACELLYRAAQRGRSVGFVSASSLPVIQWDRREDAREILTVDLLVIDDVGVGHEAEAAWGAVSSAIRDRYAWSATRPVILTTNFGENEDPSKRRGGLIREFLARDRGLGDRIHGGAIFYVDAKRSMREPKGPKRQ